MGSGDPSTSRTKRGSGDSSFSHTQTVIRSRPNIHMDPARGCAQYINIWFAVEPQLYQCYSPAIWRRQPANDLKRRSSNRRDPTLYVNASKIKRRLATRALKASRLAASTLAASSAFSRSFYPIIDGVPINKQTPSRYDAACMPAA